MLYYLHYTPYIYQTLQSSWIHGHIQQTVDEEEKKKHNYFVINLIYGRDFIFRYVEVSTIYYKNIPPKVW